MTRFLPGPLRFSLSLSVLLPFACFSGPSLQAADPKASLPDGFELKTVAAAPLVKHPIMATLGEPGKLFVGDAAGENMNKKELEEHLPNRVLLLHDDNRDGVYERSTVFADKMTFPQGAVWLEGSLYVMSPPGLWKLTDKNGDGVADEREMLVSGFEYTGNAADVHGPFLHPNGRLYWAHGRKGHTATQRDGKVVHEGRASGIWSCRPDGLDLRWHSLGCGDNPVEVDFTPEGEIIGDQNIFYTNPRGDTIVHWLRGGVYPRPDQLKAIEGLPRTLDTMPVVHNFGHVGVSGLTFYRSGAFDPAWRGSLFVTHFNTQRLTRMELIPDGGTYKTVEREFLKLHDPDIHLTDVLEDRDGSLLVLDTGGWFRIGCPSSLMAKPDIAGAIFRISKKDAPARVTPWGAQTSKVWAFARRGNTKAVIDLLQSDDVSVARAAGNALAMLPTDEAIPALLEALDHAEPGVQLAAAHALGALPKLDANVTTTLLKRITGEVDRAVEHQVMFALLTAGDPATMAGALEKNDQPALQKRVLTILDQTADSPLTAERVTPLLDASDPALAKKAAELIVRHEEWVPAAGAHFAKWLQAGTLPAQATALIELVATKWLGQPAITPVVTALLDAKDEERQRTGWRIVAAAELGKTPESWSASLAKSLTSAAPADLPLVLTASAKLATPDLRTALRDFSTDAKQPLNLRLKALGASLPSGAPLAAESFTLLKQSLNDVSASARIEAARILASSKLTNEQVGELAPAISSAGPLELREFLRAMRRWLKTDAALPVTQALKNSASLASLQESEIRTVYSEAPKELFAELAPALQAIADDEAAKRRLLETLPDRIAKEGRPEEGKKLYEMGMGACMTCHRAGEVGNLVGPDLSKIGAIRVERDLLESILFPSNSLARDYEAHSIETADGQNLIGVVRGSLPDVLVVADAGAQEHRIPHRIITANTTLPTSLMPSGLEKALTEQQLMDLVAYLRSRR